jgi:hypothetical protein
VHFAPYLRVAHWVGENVLIKVNVYVSIKGGRSVPN